jgi:hypothetical protein
MGQVTNDKLVTGGRAGFDIKVMATNKSFG